MKIRTLLFGAGSGAATYMDNTAWEREFIGLLDNDPDKVGQNVHGLPVFAPKDVQQLEFDQIVITTQWAIPVQNQLVDKLRVSADKVMLPEKNLLKQKTPFRDQRNLELGRNIIARIGQLSVQQKIPLVVDFGTLLGLVRDGDIISWDDDIDFSAPFQHAEGVENVIRQFVAEESSQQWVIYKGHDKTGRVTGLWLDFCCDEAQRLTFCTSFCFRENRDGQALHMPSLGMWFAPQHHFNGTELLSWKGVSVQVPREYHDYLTFQYGDWKTPKQNIQLIDYANLNQVGFEQIKEAGHVVEAVLDSRR